MRRVLVVLVLVAATGCAGRWLSVDQPIRPSPTRPPRDYRVVLRNDSVLILHSAVFRDDSLVELRQRNDSGVQPSRGVDMLDVVRVEAWSPGAERTAGGVIVTLLAGLLTVAYLLLRGLGGPGS